MMCMDWDGLGWGVRFMFVRFAHASLGRTRNTALQYLICVITGVSRSRSYKLKVLKCKLQKEQKDNMLMDMEVGDHGNDDDNDEEDVDSNDKTTNSNKKQKLDICELCCRRDRKWHRL